MTIGQRNRRIIDLYMDGKELEEIAHEVRCNLSTVKAVVLQFRMYGSHVFDSPAFATERDSYIDDHHSRSTPITAGEIYAYLHSLKKGDRIHTADNQTATVIHVFPSIVQTDKGYVSLSDLGKYNL